MLIGGAGISGNIILNILSFIFIAFILGYSAAHIVGEIKKIKESGANGSGLI